MVVAVAQTEVPARLTVTTNTTFYYIASIHTSIEAANPASAALDDLQAAIAVAPTLLADHVASWANIWASGVEISGRPDVAMAVNAR